MRNHLRSLSELKEYAKKISLFDIYSNQSRSVFAPVNNDTRPDMPDCVRENLQACIDAKYYIGTNWYGAMLNDNTPRFLPINLLEEWYFKELVSDIQYYLIGQWYNTTLPGNKDYQTFLCSETKKHIEKVCSLLKEEPAYNEEHYKFLAILDGTVPPCLLNMGR